jgi:hypothetical protein
MLGFTSTGAGSFLSRGTLQPKLKDKDRDKDAAKRTIQQNAHGAKRFFVLRQGYLRSSRRILEISPGMFFPTVKERCGAYLFQRRFHRRKHSASFTSRLSGQIVDKHHKKAYARNGESDVILLPEIRRERHYTAGFDTSSPRADRGDYDTFHMAH